MKTHKFQRSRNKNNFLCFYEWRRTIAQVDVQCRSQARDDFTVFDKFGLVQMLLLTLLGRFVHDHARRACDSRQRTFLLRDGLGCDGSLEVFEGGSGTCQPNFEVGGLPVVSRDLGDELRVDIGAHDRCSVCGTVETSSGTDSRPVASEQQTRSNTSVGTACKAAEAQVVSVFAVSVFCVFAYVQKQATKGQSQR